MSEAAWWNLIVDEDEEARVISVWRNNEAHAIRADHQQSHFAANLPSLVAPSP
jgi:hypothetical protein